MPCSCNTLKRKGGMVTHDFVFVPVNLGQPCIIMVCGLKKRRGGESITDLYNKIHPDTRARIEKHAKEGAIQGVKQLAKKGAKVAALVGAPIIAKKIYKKIRKNK